jgi:hypothetical protein
VVRKFAKLNQEKKAQLKAEEEAAKAKAGVVKGDSVKAGNGPSSATPSQSAEQAKALMQHYRRFLPFCAYQVKSGENVC